MTTFLSNRSIYTSVICGIVPQVKERLWIATADIKDMYVDAAGRDMVPFLEVLDGMVKRGVVASSAALVAAVSIVQILWRECSHSDLCWMS